MIITGEPKEQGAIKQGDKVTIQARGTVVVGMVLQAEYWPGDGGWYIEMSPANVPGNYSYWKQDLDGGNILMVQRGATDED